jgi:hypothetical protein
VTGRRPASPHKSPASDLGGIGVITLASPPAPDPLSTAPSAPPAPLLPDVPPAPTEMLPVPVLLCWGGGLEGSSVAEQPRSDKVIETETARSARKCGSSMVSSIEITPASCLVSYRA